MQVELQENISPANLICFSLKQFMDAQVRWVCVPEEAIFDRNLQQEQRFPNSFV